MFFTDEGRGGLFCAGVAQLVEHLTCNQVVGGSSPFASFFIFYRVLG